MSRKRWVRSQEASDRVPGKSLEKIVAKLRKNGYSVETHDRVASVPRGYAAEHPRIELLRMKDIFAGKQFEPAKWLSSRGALDRIKRVIKDIEPLREWIRVHVGARGAH